MQTATFESSGQAKDVKIYTLSLRDEVNQIDARNTRKSLKKHTGIQKM